MDEENNFNSNDSNEDIEVVYLDDEEVSDALDQQDCPEDLAKLTFYKHTRAVFDGALSKNGLLAVTGSEDDMAYVWSTETLEVLLECTGHKDSVTQVGFNFDDEYIVTGDMGGLIQVWRVNEKKLMWCYEGDDMEWSIWHQMANVLFVGTNVGDIYVWQIPQGNCKVLSSHGAATTCGKILPDGKRLIAGYSDGQVCLWDIKLAKIIWKLTENIPSCGITSLDVSEDSYLFVVAPTAQLFKVADGRQIGCLLATNEEEIEVAVFNRDCGLLATGALSKKLCIWDIKKLCLRHEAWLDQRITVIKWSIEDKLIVGVTDGSIYICNSKSGTLLECLTGHTDDILSLSITTDGSKMLSTSDDSTAKIFCLKSE